MAYSHSRVSKTSRKLYKKLKKLRGSIVLIIIGLILLGYGGFNYYKIRILSFTKPVAPASAVSQKGSDPMEIIIPSIKIDEPVDTGTIKDGVWQISYDHPTFLDSSARPGTNGNVVIYGHNKKVIFGNLPYLSLGQTITIKTKGGKTYNYIADQKYFVGPDRVDLVSPTDNEELTIYTCWGVFDSERAVIKAKPLTPST